ncbi:MAG: hypothetical protein V1672_00870 [Candidatus Diapherotrites archaeon]
MDMEINPQYSARYALIGVSVFVSVMLWAFFLGLVGNLITSFLDFELETLISQLMSFNFILFLIFFPLTYALITAFQMKFKKFEVLLFSFAGVVIAMFMSALLFSALLGYSLLIPFYLISVFLVNEISDLRFKELKGWKVFRTASKGVGMGISVLAVGFLFFGVVTLLPNNADNVKEIEDKFISEITNSISDDDIASQYADTSAELFIAGQKSVIDEITDTPQYDATEDLQLKTAIDAVDNEINSKKYQNTVKEEYANALAENQSDIREKIDVIDVMKKQFPFIKILENFAWAFQSLVLASSFMFFGTFIFRPLGVIYGVIIGKILLSSGSGKTQ